MKKNKLLTKLLAMTIAISAAFGFVACTPTKVPDTEQTLEVYIINKGMGYKWLQDLLDLFKKQDWVKAKYPNLEIIFTQNDSWNYATGKLTSGERHNTIDLIFGLGLADFFGDNKGLLELTECVYKQELPDGSGDTLGDKMSKSAKEAYRYYTSSDLDKQSYYATPWGIGFDGIACNKTLLANLGLEVPRTTDELAEACSVIKADGSKACFLQSAGAAYFNYLFEIWWAQYEGLANYTNFWSGLSDNKYSNDIFNQKGREESLKVFEEILDFDKGYVDPRSFRFSTQETQRAFFQGAAAFHANGSYVFDETENSDNVSDSFTMMRAPIISALGEKLGITDEILGELVDYADGKTTEVPTFTSTTEYTNEEVIEAVLEARTFIHDEGQDCHSVIPEYAKGKDIAIDFLLFMATDKALESYAKSTNGALLPYDYDFKAENPTLYNSFRDAMKDIIDVLHPQNENVRPGYLLPSPKNFPLVKFGKLSAFTTSDYYQTFSAENNTKTPADYMKDSREAWTENKFTDALEKAGLLK